MSQSSIHGIEGIKQKRKYLSIDQTVDLTEKAERGYSVTQLAKNSTSVKKERFSALLCCNADGSNRTKYAIVGKSANLRALKNCMNRLPVIYYNTKNAWFTQIIFEDWFQNHFCKEVKKQQINMCRIHPAEIKSMLLTDNAPAHPNAKLTSPDGKITCIALPPNTTSVIQPMD
nr:tigger transposable element-derived protein 7-like [Procambarus clarkii]